MSDTIQPSIHKMYVLFRDAYVTVTLFNQIESCGIEMSIRTIKSRVSLLLVFSMTANQKRSARPFIARVFNSMMNAVAQRRTNFRCLQRRRRLRYRSISM